jgi:hypothetical protein
MVSLAAWLGRQVDMAVAREFHGLRRRLRRGAGARRGHRADGRSGRRWPSAVVKRPNALAALAVEAGG